MINHLVLASASPRRRELLGKMGVKFICAQADIDEECQGAALAQVQELARRKALAVAREMPDMWVLGADTLVERQGKVLGKPADENAAMETLLHLQNGWHQVHTGIALVSPTGDVKSAVETSFVHFTPMTRTDILAYIATGEPMDKAGAYGIQGYAGQFIDRIEGCYFNIVGLPMAKLRSLLMMV